MTCSWVESLSIVKMSHLPKFIYRWKKKIHSEHMKFLKRKNDKVISKIQMKIMKVMINQNNLEEDEVWGHTGCQSMPQKGSGRLKRWVSKSHSPKSDLHRYGHLIYDKGGGAVQWGEDSFFFFKYMVLG